eukprot:TRINITY_DN2102_c0_g1_i4.p1 TRINITY_DN2102_c0_g1~~TRINITY_DN2102_c0_g1_i4.p1  ORF type:complete len:328 (+),score=87.06 TRINITY_DN2102_c0_g1_i4:237-1220(+)
MSSGGGGRSLMRQCGSFMNKTCSKFNQLLSYKSQKTVRVIDRRMGLLAIALRLMILGYLAIAIYLSEAYKDTEYTTGALIARGSGESYSTDNHLQVRFWDFADVLYPPTEVGAIFIATRVIRTNLQTIQLCANPAHPCSPENAANNNTDDDAADAGGGADRRLLAEPAAPAPPTNTQSNPSYPSTDSDGAVEDPQCIGVQNGVEMPTAPYGTGQCAGTGAGCLEYVWCPAEGVNSLRTLDMELQRLGTYTVQFQSAISFPVFDPDGVPLQYNHTEMTLTELLAQVGATEEEAMQTGAVISARVMYECDADAGDLQACVPTVTLRRCC